MEKPRGTRQARGQKRREEILAAASMIINESGRSAVTMHLTARRAGASIGSIYHFFSGPDELLAALDQTHADAILDIIEEARNLPDADWHAMTVEEVVDALFGRAIRYLSRNPAGLSSLQELRRRGEDEFEALVERVVTLRIGQEDAPRVASLLYATSTGTLLFLTTSPAQPRPDLISSIIDVLTAYLKAAGA